MTTTQPTITAHNKDDGLEKEFFDLGLNDDGYQILVGLIDDTKHCEQVQFLVKSPQGQLEFFPKYYLADVLDAVYGLTVYNDVPQWDITVNQMQTAIWWLRRQIKAS